jgi:hypothetical protein
VRNAECGEEINMKKIYSGIILLLLGALSVLIVLSCGEEVTTGEKTLTGLNIFPSSASLEVGSTQSFAVTASYSDGTTSFPVASWSVTGEIGTIEAVGLNALFTATAEGSGSVEASYGGFTASASVTVTGEAAAALSSITVSPSQKSMRIGESETFTASGTSTTGEAMGIAPAWSLSGDAIGVLTASGTTATLEANAEGSATISCVSGEVTGNSYVTVEGYTVEITVETDTYVDEANPAATHGSATSLKAGYVSATGKHYEAYFKFLLDLVPGGASVESATLRVYPSSAGSSALQLKKLDSAFSDSTTWESRPTLGSFIASGVFTIGDYNNISDDDLTTLVRNWKSGASANYGLALVQEGAVDGVVVILSKENGSNPPLLKVEYTIP